MMWIIGWESGDNNSIDISTTVKVWIHFFPLNTCISALCGYTFIYRTIFFLKKTKQLSWNSFVLQLYIQMMKPQPFTTVQHCPVIYVTWFALYESTYFYSRRTAREKGRKKPRSALYMRQNGQHQHPCFGHLCPIFEVIDENPCVELHRKTLYLPYSILKTSYCLIWWDGSITCNLKLYLGLFILT